LLVGYRPGKATPSRQHRMLAESAIEDLAGSGSFVSQFDAAE
jgi:hypothetical protein